MAGSFDDSPRQDVSPGGCRGGPRPREAERDRVAPHLVCPDDLPAPEHGARAVWGSVERLDPTGLYAAIESVEGGAGHPAADPNAPVSLWPYATLQGVGSARAGPFVREPRRLPVAVRRTSKRPFEDGSAESRWRRRRAARERAARGGTARIVARHIADPNSGLCKTGR